MSCQYFLVELHDPLAPALVPQLVKAGHRLGPQGVILLLGTGFPRQQLV